MQFLRNLTQSLKSNGRGRLYFLPGFDQNLPTFVATIDIDYVQRIAVGVEAARREHALQLVRRAFDAGTLWNDTPNMPVLMHAFEPMHPDTPLQNVSLVEVDELPPADPSVTTMKCVGASHALLRFARLVEALCDESTANGETRGEPAVIELPAQEVTQLRQLLRSLDAA